MYVVSNWRKSVVDEVDRHTVKKPDECLADREILLYKNKNLDMCPIDKTVALME